MWRAWQTQSPIQKQKNENKLIDHSAPANDASMDASVPARWLPRTLVHTDELLKGPRGTPTRYGLAARPGLPELSGPFWGLEDTSESHLHHTVL